MNMKTVALVFGFCLSCGVGAARAETTIPASAYVQRGLIAQWDGIENGGAGIHDANATEWKELKSGTVNFSISDCTIGADSVTIPKKKKVGISSSVFPNWISNAHSGTYEYYWATPDIPTDAGSYETVVMMISDMSFLYRIDKNLFQGTARMADGKFYRENFSYTAAEQAAFHTVSYQTQGTTTADNRFYLSGEFRAGTAKGGETMGQSARTGLVWSDASPYSVVFKSARIYDRVLDESEVKFNANIDKIRFEGADPETLIWPEGYRLCDGKPQVRVSVKLTGLGGTVSVAGGDSEVWVEPGETVSFVAEPADGMPILVWHGGTPTKTGDNIYSIMAEVPVSLDGIVGNRLVGWTGAAEDGLWTSAGNWDSGAVPAEDDCVFISGGATVTLAAVTPQLASLTLSGNGTTLTMKEPTRAAPEGMTTVLKASAVNVLGGAVITHVREDMTVAEATAAGEWQMDGRVNIACRDLIVDAESKIDATAKGYYIHSSRANVGPTVRDSLQIAGWHGARSVNPRLSTFSTTTGLTLDGAAYDDPRAPVWPGVSGGVGDNATVLLASGGAIKIAATRLVTIDGVVSADAETYGGAFRNGAAGGSVWITCEALAGSGRISADGSINTASQNTSGGSGGCIALAYDPDAQRTAGVPAKLRISCNSKSTATTFSDGLPGTVYMPDAQFLSDTFSTAGGVESGLLVLDNWTGWNPTKLSLTDARIRLPSEAVNDLTLSSITVSGFGARLDFGGEDGFMIARSAYTDVSACQPKITVNGNVSLVNGGKLRIVPAATNGTELAVGAILDVKGDLTLSSGSKIWLGGHSLDGAACRLWADNVTMDAGSAITADDQGFSGATNGVKMCAFGPGFGEDYALGPSHGGYGSRLCSNAGRRLPYGSLSAPTLPGSGGGIGNANVSGSRGGGVVWLTVANDFVCNGNISVNGQANLGDGSGTGSGGSVYVTCKTFQGAGKITANGGEGQRGLEDRCGAGGRIAIVYDSSAQAALAEQPTVAFCASSRTTDTCNVAQGYGTLYLTDAQFVPTGVFSPASMAYVAITCGDWSSWRAGDVSVTNCFVRFCGAAHFECDSLTVKKGGRLDIGGDDVWSHYRGGRIVCQSGKGIDLAVKGTVSVENGGTLSLYGGNTNAAVGVMGKTPDYIVSGELTAHTIKVADNAWIYAYSHPVEGGSYRIVCREAEIAAGGGISAAERGWSGLGTTSSAERQRLSKTGAGREGYGLGCGMDRGQGGGYGGKGGNGGGSVYGNMKRPCLPGSGAGSADGTDRVSGQGGGLVWLKATTAVDLKGTITADGCAGSIGMSMSAGGSGGGVVVMTPTLSVAAGAAITARGGDSGFSANAGAGGGGRIAILANNYRDLNVATNAGDLVVSVAPGQNGQHADAGEGTVNFAAYPGGLMLLFL